MGKRRGCKRGRGEGRGLAGSPDSGAAGGGSWGLSSPAILSRRLCAPPAERPSRWMGAGEGEAGEAARPAPPADVPPAPTSLKETAQAPHRYRGCSDVSEGDRSGMERDVEDSVVAMEAVVASSKDGGVQGRRSGRPVGRGLWAPAAGLPGLWLHLQLGSPSAIQAPAPPATQHSILLGSFKRTNTFEFTLGTKASNSPLLSNCDPNPPQAHKSCQPARFLSPPPPDFSPTTQASCCPSNIPGPVLPQGLCTCSFSLPGCYSPLPSPSLPVIFDSLTLGTGRDLPKHHAQPHQVLPSSRSLDIW